MIYNGLYADALIESMIMMAGSITKNFLFILKFKLI